MKTIAQTAEKKKRRFFANEMEIKMKRTNQMSESLRLGMLLAVSGGFMDAYSYLLRDHVFANAQTGNILLFGVHLSEGNFGAAARYFLPVFAFAAGIALAELVRLKKSAAGHMAALLHWRQRAVLVEALILAGVAFFPLTMNPLANALTSFACGIQVESFRKIRGNGIATTMCIGNLRSGTQSLCQFLFQNKCTRRPANAEIMNSGQKHEFSFSVRCSPQRRLSAIRGD